jgi:hypothetical protein
MSYPLPAEFADLQQFADKWALDSEHARYTTRLASSMDEMRALYETVFPRAQAAMTYLDAQPFGDLPEESRNLLHLLYSLVQVSFPVEVWHQPRVPDTGSAAFDCYLEPTP